MKEEAPAKSNSVGIYRELPKYRCHKIVHALKIKDITNPNNATDGSRLIYFEEEGYAPIAFERRFIDNHNPQIGGYYVVYEDGYKSYSPAKAFVEGYTKI